MPQIIKSTPRIAPDAFLKAFISGLGIQTAVGLREKVAFWQFLHAFDHFVRQRNVTADLRLRAFYSK